MPLSSCPRCKELFQKNKEQLVCNKCLDAEEADYERIRDFVYLNPDSTPTEVAAATGIPDDVVMRLVDTGRIAQVQAGTTVRCGRCGAPAISLAKRLCETCLAELNADLARSKSSIKLPPKKWTNIETGKSSTRKRIDDARGSE